MTQINNITPETKNAVANLPYAYMAHEVHAEGRITIDQAVAFLADQLGIDEGDTSLNARALRELIGCQINEWGIEYDNFADMDEYEEIQRSGLTTMFEQPNPLYWICYDIYDTYDNADFMLEYAKTYGDADDVAKWQKEKLWCDEYRYRKAA